MDLEAATASPNPRPPTAEEAARLVECASSKDADWGALVAHQDRQRPPRRDLRPEVDLDHAMITIRRGIYLDDHGHLRHEDPAVSARWAGLTSSHARPSSSLVEGFHGYLHTKYALTPNPFG